MSYDHRVHERAIMDIRYALAALGFDIRDTSDATIYGILCDSFTWEKVSARS